MRIAILGSAPSSLQLAPFGDLRYKIWACSPGTYSVLPRCDAFFELHRWEPGIVGKPHTQKQWFSPEYVAWMGQQVRVWMYQPVPEIPNSMALPVADLESKYGTFFFTSSMAWMMACAMEDILEEREQLASQGLPPVEDVIALYGVDMAANEEWGYQRAGCQHFIELAATMGIKIEIPPESDLMRPSPRYGIDESEPWMIKLTARRGELTRRLDNARAQQAGFAREVAFLEGALDDLNYMQNTWVGEREPRVINPDILACSPVLRQAVLDSMAREAKPVVDMATEQLDGGKLSPTELMQQQQPGRRVMKIG